MCAYLAHIACNCSIGTSGRDAKQQQVYRSDWNTCSCSVWCVLYRTVVIKVLLCSAPYQENKWRRIKDLRFLNEGPEEAGKSSAQTDRHTIRPLTLFLNHGSVHRESSWITVQEDATVFSLLYFCRHLYMFRVLTPIIRSPYNCNYSFWHYSTAYTTIRSRCWISNSTTRADGSRPCWTVPEAVITVVRAPDGECQHPKHVELSTEVQ